jgi:hypothetical protein
MAFRRIKANSPAPSRLDRLRTEDLETALETSLSRTAELFRGLQHREIDTRWLLEQMRVEIDQASMTIQALQRKVEI